MNTILNVNQFILAYKRKQNFEFKLKLKSKYHIATVYKNLKQRLLIHFDALKVICITKNLISIYKVSMKWIIFQFQFQFISSLHMWAPFIEFYYVQIIVSKFVLTLLLLLLLTETLWIKVAHCCPVKFNLKLQNQKLLALFCYCFVFKSFYNYFDNYLNDLLRL